MSQFKEINEWVRKEKVSLFLGAGFSLKAGAPSCRNLINTIINGIPSEDRDEIDKTYLDKASQQFVDYYDREKLIHLIKPLFNFERKDLNDHIALSRIPHFKRIFTTNYDTLLEETYGDKCVVIKGNGDIQNQDEGKAIIYKIHGDFDGPNEMIITSDDYTRFHTFPHKTLIWDIFKGLLASGPMLFMGYSLDDSNLKYIIDRLNTESGRHNHPIYLIVPSLPTYKRKELEKKGIKIFYAKAEDFFNNLFIDLDKNIFKDVERKRVSESTFHTYCQYRNLNVEILSKLQRNEISNIKSLNNAPHKINFSVKDHIASMILKDKEIFNSHINFNGVRIPAYKFSSESITDFSFTINGVQIQDKEDISNILIAPKHKSIQSIIRIPSLDFREKTEIILYGANNSATAVIKAMGYQLYMTFHIKDEKTINVTLKVDFEEKFSDLNGVRRWMNLLLALWNGKEVQFSQLFNNETSFTLNPPTTQLVHTDFEERIKYLDNIRDIEDRLKIIVDKYNAYSPEIYEESYILLSYLTGRAYNQELPLNSTLSFQITSSLENEEDNKNLTVGNKNLDFGTVSEINRQLNFYGRMFNIPYHHILYHNCEIISNNLLNNGICLVKIKIHGNLITQWYSDDIHPSFKPANNVDNKLPPESVPLIYYDLKTKK